MENPFAVGKNIANGVSIAHSVFHIMSFILPLIEEGQLSVTGETMCTWSFEPKNLS